MRIGWMQMTSVKKLLLIPIIVLLLCSQSVALAPTMALVGGCLIVDDDFTGANGSQPSSVLWTQGDGGDDMTIESNKLHFDLTGTGGTLTYITGKWTFPANSNFDVQIDFDVTTLDAPDSGWNYAAYFRVGNSGLTTFIYIARGNYQGSTDGYASYGTATESNNYAQADASGKLRFVMSGCPGACVLKAYNWYNSQWEWNGSTAGLTCSEDFSSDVVYINISFNKEATSGSTTVDANVDNFLVNSGCAE